MGAADGKWKANERFSRAPANIITLLEDVTIPWVPADVVVRNWDVGINMAMSYNEQFYAMPAIQTVNSDDSSILNNWLPTLAIAYLHKVAHAAWREFRGTDDLSDSELVLAVNNFVSNQISGIWDNRYTVIPRAEVTVDDQLRATSWHLNVDFGASSAKTIEIFKVTAFQRATLDGLQ